MAGASFPPGVTIEVDNADLDSWSSINITSTLIVSNVSALNGSSLSCGDPGGGSSNMVNVMVNSPGEVTGFQKRGETSNYFYLPCIQ